MKRTLITTLVAFSLSALTTQCVTAGEWENINRGFYGGMGAWAGSAGGLNPGGGIVGGGLGNQIGGFVGRTYEDSYREHFSGAHQPRYTPQYQQPEYRTHQSTPYMRRRNW